MKVKELLSENLDKEKHEQIVQSYLDQYRSYLQKLSPFQQRKECISGHNRISRASYWSSEALRIDIHVGDLCYLDYGHAFINEAGYQHFGLVISSFNYKLLVVPMTSNPDAIRQARNVSCIGKEHLYFIGKIPGLNKPSVLFLNDCKFVNSARVISVNGHMNPKSGMFQDILKTLIDRIFGLHMIK